MTSFKAFLEEHKDEIRALQVLYSRPYRNGSTFSEDQGPSCRPYRAAAASLDHRPAVAPHMTSSSTGTKVRGSGHRILTDVISLVRFALRQDDELVPYRDLVEARFEGVVGYAGTDRRRSSRTNSGTGWAG